MWLIRTALRRPISVLVLVIAVALCAVLATLRMRTDIFPDLDLPVIYVAQPYGGMSPAQMEGYLVFYYEYHFLYINGIESVEDKSIQGNGLLKLTFHPGTDMSQALAQTIAYVNRAHAFMPYGTVNPFVIRFDAGTVPVGYLVFSSKSRTIGEIQDLALNRIRPLFATLPGVSAPPPFGGNQRTIVVTVNPDRLRSYNLSPDAVVQAISSGNILMPAGNVRTDSLLRIVSSDSVTPDIHTLLDVPIRTGAGPTVYLRDVGAVADSTDIPTGYALVNSRRAVYIPVTKRPDASTLTVVDEVKQSLARFRSLVPVGHRHQLSVRPIGLRQERSALCCARRVAGRFADRSHRPALLGRLAKLVHRHDHHSLRAADLGGGSVGVRPNYQHYDARRAGVGRGHSGGRRRGGN